MYHAETWGEDAMSFNGARFFGEGDALTRHQIAFGGGATSACALKSFSSIGD
jgi:hypothetical protein